MDRTPRPISEGNVSSFGAALSGIFNPMFVEMILHRTFANLSWPAFALAAWAAFMYIRSKTEADKAFYDWTTSVGLTWGTGFLLIQPISGFFDHLRDAVRRRLLAAYRRGRQHHHLEPSRT